MELDTFIWSLVFVPLIFRFKEKKEEEKKIRLWFSYLRKFKYLRKIFTKSERLKIKKEKEKYIYLPRYIQIFTNHVRFLKFFWNAEFLTE